MCGAGGGGGEAREGGKCRWIEREVRERGREYRAYVWGGKLDSHGAEVSWAGPVL